MSFRSLNFLLVLIFIQTGLDPPVTSISRLSPLSWRGSARQLLDAAAATATRPRTYAAAAAVLACVLVRGSCSPRGGVRLCDAYRALRLGTVAVEGYASSAAWAQLASVLMQAPSSPGDVVSEPG